MSYDEPKAEAVGQMDRMRRIKKTPQEVMAWLLERMRRREAGRQRIKMAERKRRIKASRRIDLCDASPKWDEGRRSVGETKLEGDKPFYYQNGVLWKDGLGNKALEVIGRIELGKAVRKVGWFVCF